MSVEELSDNEILGKIYLIRGYKFMLDRDLALLFGVETKRLKEQVKRNLKRFPSHYMFELTKKELEDWRSQNATSNQEIMGMRYLPYAFTEHGILMLSSVLKSDLAIKMSIRIIDLFVAMRSLLLEHRDVLLKLNQVDKHLADHDDSIEMIINYLKQFQINNVDRNPIDFKQNEQEKD